MGCFIEADKRNIINQVIDYVKEGPRNYGYSQEALNLLSQSLLPTSQDANAESAKAQGTVSKLVSLYTSMANAFRTDRDIPNLKDNLDKLYAVLSFIREQNDSCGVGTTIDSLQTSAILSSLSSNSTPTPSTTSSSSTSSTTTPGATPAATTTAPKANIAQCANPYKDRWGVKFKYQATSNTTNGCTPTNAPTTLNEWYLTLLPAMRSVIPNNGGMDVPGALPGLQFQIRSNIAKHKIPGFQPLYQHLGVDSIIITLVGTFTGDGGLGSTYDVQTKTSNAIGVRYTPWDQGGGRDTDVNPIWNEIVPTHNRAARGTVTLDANGNVVPATYNPYNANTGGAVSTNGIGINDQIYNVSTGDPNVFMIKDLTRNGMWNRDGCPGDCEPYNKEYDAYSPKDGSLTMNNPRQMLNKDQDVFGAYTLRELAAYNDSYHEFISFYKMAIHEARELEIEINLRRNSDGLNPQVNQFLQYGRDAVGYLRNDQGNPAFKGVVKNMRVFHARSDRTWYSMEIEVTDYGMAGGQALNLTKRIEDQAKKALEATLAASRAAQTKAENATDPDFYVQVDKECFVKWLKQNNQKGNGVYLSPRDEILFGKRLLEYSLNNYSSGVTIEFINNGEVILPNGVKTPEGNVEVVYKSLTATLFLDRKTGLGLIDSWGKEEKNLEPKEFIDRFLKIEKEEAKIKEFLKQVLLRSGVKVTSPNIRSLEERSKCSKSTPSTASSSGSSSTTSSTSSETTPADTTTSPDAKPSETTSSSGTSNLGDCTQEYIAELDKRIENISNDIDKWIKDSDSLIINSSFWPLQWKKVEGRQLLNRINSMKEVTCNDKQKNLINSLINKIQTTLNLL